MLSQQRKKVFKMRGKKAVRYFPKILIFRSTYRVVELMHATPKCYNSGVRHTKHVAGFVRSERGAAGMALGVGAVSKVSTPDMVIVLY